VRFSCVEPSRFASPLAVEWGWKGFDRHALRQVLRHAAFANFAKTLTSDIKFLGKMAAMPVRFLSSGKARICRRAVCGRRFKWAGGKRWQVTHLEPHMGRAIQPPARGAVLRRHAVTRVSARGALQ